MLCAKQEPSCHVCLPAAALHSAALKGTVTCRYALTWETQDQVPSLGSYYLNTITALYAVCPGCLFLIEGTGQSTYCGVNWYAPLLCSPVRL